MHTSLQLVVDFNDRQVYALAKLWVPLKPGATKILLHLRSSARLQSVAVNDVPAPIKHLDLLSAPSVCVSTLQPDGTRSACGLETYDAMFRVACCKAGEGELEISLPPGVCALPSGSVSPSGSSAAGCVIVTLSYTLSQPNLPSVTFSPFLPPPHCRATHSTHTSAMTFLACGGPSVVGGVDGSGAVGVRCWLPCIDTAGPLATSTFHIALGLLGARCTTTGSPTAPAGDDSAPTPTSPQLLRCVVSGECVGSELLVFTRPRPGLEPTTHTLRFHNFVTPPILPNGLAIAIGPFQQTDGVGSTPAPLSLPVCALAPSCFSPIVPKCVAEMDLALHEIKTELGVFPRWKQFQFVFLPLPPNSPPITFFGGCFISTSSLAHCFSAPEEMLTLQRVMYTELALSWIQSRLSLAAWTDAWIFVGLAGSLASMCMERRFGAGESQFILYTLQQELFKLEDTYPHLLCLRPLEPASLDTLASQHPCYDTFVRVKAPLVWHMLRGFVSTELIHAALAAVISAAEEPSPDAPAFSDATPDVLPSLAPVLSREESDSGITPAVHAGSVKLSHIRSIGVSTDALIEYLCAEGSEDDAGYIRRFASEWISGTGYPRFRVSYSYNRTHNKANFRVEQLVREAGKLFHGELTIRLHESNKRVTDKRKNRIDKAVSQFTFKPSERKRAAGPERLRAGRRRDELKLAVSKEEILADQSDIKNKTQVDDDGVVTNDQSVQFFRIDPEYMWIRRIELKCSETLSTTQLREDTNLVSQMEALSALIGIEIDADDTRRSLSVIRTLKKCVTSPDVHYRVRAFACAVLSKWQHKHSPRVNACVSPVQSWHGLATLISVYKEKYCDMSGMPLQYAVTSVADSVVRRALVRSIGSCIHSDGIAPLPAVGILIRLLSYHELPPGAMLDDSAFLSDLIEAVRMSALRANPPTGLYESCLSFMEEDTGAAVSSDTDWYVMVPASSSGASSGSVQVWSGSGATVVDALRPYDDPRSTAQPLKALNPYMKPEELLQIRAARRRQARVDPKESATLMGVSDRVGGVTKSSKMVSLAMQALRRLLVLTAEVFHTPTPSDDDVSGPERVLSSCLNSLSALAAKFTTLVTLDVTIDYLAYTAPRYPLGVRLAAFQSYLRVAVERTPWDSGTSKLDTEVDFDGAEAGEVPDFVTRSEVEMSERKERWFCSLLRALAVLRNDADAAFQSGAAKALYDIQWDNCSRKAQWLRDKMGTQLNDLSVEELLTPNAYSAQPSTRSTLRLLLKSALVDELLRHARLHLKPHSHEMVHDTSPHPAMSLWFIMNHCCAFNWQLRRTLYHLYHSVWGVTTPCQLPPEFIAEATPLASIPWMGPLLQLIQEDRGGIDRRANTLASQLVADISRDIFDDERDQRSKRQQDIEEMAIRRMDKDFFEKYRPRVVLHRLPNDSYIPMELYTRQLNAERLKKAANVKLKSSAAGIETDVKTGGARPSKPLPTLGVGAMQKQASGGGVVGTVMGPPPPLMRPTQSSVLPPPPPPVLGPRVSSTVTPPTSAPSGSGGGSGGLKLTLKLSTPKP